MEVGTEINEKINQLSIKKQITSYEQLTREKKVIEYWNSFLNSDHIKGRAKFFADQIDQLCQETNTGIIGIFGWILGDVIENLSALGYNNTQSFFILNPAQANEASTIDEIMLSYASELVYSQLFPSTEIIELDQFSSSNALESYILERMGMDSVSVEAHASY